MTVLNPATQTPACHTLWDAPKKAAVCVVQLLAGLNPQVVNRLYEMGLEPGQTLLCLGRGPFNGPLIVQIQDSFNCANSGLCLYARAASRGTYSDRTATVIAGSLPATN
jgi:ferrous iron transport protein A